MNSPVRHGGGGDSSRGTGLEPANRFEEIRYEPDPDSDLDPREAPERRTQFLRDLSVSVISRNDSPDIPFRVSLNPYRGCEHGCVYCYARPTHEYLGFSAGLDFESRILVKERAPELLRGELSASSWVPQWMALSGVTDAYQPIERRLGLTRRCLEVLVEFRQPVGIVTKNALVSRDRDLLAQLARYDAASVAVSLTTLDPDLRRVLEPRTSPPAARLKAIGELAAAGVPVGVMIAPVIPAVNDHEIPGLLEAAKLAGACFASYTLVRLPHAVKELFSDWLARHFPDRREKVLHRLEAMRGGRLNDPRFGSRLRGEGMFAYQIQQLFQAARRRSGLEEHGPRLDAGSFRRPGGTQLRLL
ncbi:MAG: PA0069 family radical SAM protein [Verrucomicrobiae bacterium]|nr:PA0069 family radical SAM protein [Verrucomicrobiae bacterium]